MDANKLEWLKLEQAREHPFFHKLTDMIESPDDVDVERWRLAALRWRKRAAVISRVLEDHDYSNAVAELDAAAAIESDWCSLTEKTQAFADLLQIEWTPKVTL
jgi:hypothetical protein